MQIRGLKFFLDACRVQSMTEAALLNQVSRPAISQAIKKLEDDLGASLLHHKKRGFELTAAGQRVALSAAQVFDGIDRLKAVALGQSARDLSGSLRIGVARVLSTYRFDDALAAHRIEHPNLTVRLRLHNSELLLDQLESRELDLAVIISDEARPGLSSEVLEAGAFVLVRPAALPVAKTTYAVSERRPETDALRLTYKSRFGKDLPVFAEVPSWDTIWNWIQRGHCGGLVPDLFARRAAARTSASTTVIKDVYPYQVRVFCRDNQRQNPLIATLTDHLSTVFRQKYAVAPTGRR